VGTVRLFEHYQRPEYFSARRASQRPAHKPVTQTVGRFTCIKFFTNIKQKHSMKTVLLILIPLVFLGMVVLFGKAIYAYLRKQQDKFIPKDKYTERLNLPATSTKDSSITESLQQFSSNPEPDRLVLFLIVAMACGMVFVLLLITLPNFISWYMTYPLFSALATVIGLFFTSDMIIRWKSSKSSEKENQCPRCGKPWAAENLSQKISVFRKSLEPLNKTENPQGNFFMYEKYNTHYKCKYCSYEWLYAKTKKLE
jgi:hypothetical protein